MDIQRKIWDYCKSKGMTDAGAAAVLGNIEAESAFKPNNVEDRCFMSDAEYTAAVDSGSYNADLFSKDAYGYGLCQWTYRTRKALLYTMAQSRGCSVADVDMQLDLLMRELTESYKSVLDTLQISGEVRECTEVFMRRFENPADQSERAISNRTGMSMKWYDRFAHTVEPVEVTYKYVTVQLRELCEGLKGEDVASLQILLAVKMRNGLDVDGDFGANTKAALMQYQAANGLTADGICGKNTWSKLLGG